MISMVYLKSQENFIYVRTINKQPATYNQQLELIKKYLFI
jgi:hypothetical protein